MLILKALSWLLMAGFIPYSRAVVAQMWPRSFGNPEGGLMTLKLPGSKVLRQCDDSVVHNCGFTRVGVRTPDCRLRRARRHRNPTLRW